MRIVVLSVLVIFMSCSSSKSTVNLDEVSEFSRSFEGKDIISFFDKGVRPSRYVKERSPMNHTFLNGNRASYEVRSIDQRTSTSLRSFKKSITNLREKENFMLLKKDSVFMKLDISSSYIFIFNGKIKMIEHYFNKKDKAQIFKYKIGETKVGYNLLVSYFEDKKVNIKFKGVIYKGNWGEYKRSSINKEPINKLTR